ncbi:uncharacterized protein B0H18DRAFT_987237 [Fomitopsis serialis]|uniref:uncharacterized protein n=1 Tax=Fomitopsis serialis TaxID=139415 RepID=UPI002008639F|nr:uncharacterized protein B0H18DRAFT_987237 [Neoantrodia serialis]KAH9932248.1 hypothetical protein B0H18DRAFT_987237 [Neoantrodia serialis]
MNQEQRGFDPTVRANGWADLCRHDALGQPGWPVYKIQMQPADLVDQHDLQPIIDDIRQDKCVLRPGMLIVGKRTKCYIAYEVSRNRLVFLKDYWRSNTHTTKPEGEVLKELRAAGVQSVPTPVAEGIDEKIERRPPTALQYHYRLVIKEIGRPLDTFSSALQLVEIIYDVLEGRCRVCQ